jgi:hypothetical protein
MIQAADTKVPWLLLFNGVPSRQSSLSASHSRTPPTGAILSLILTLLVWGQVWLDGMLMTGTQFPGAMGCKCDR